MDGSAKGSVTNAHPDCIRNNGAVITLPARRAEIDNRQQAFACVRLPSKRNELLVRGIAIPRLMAIKQFPVAVANDRPLQQFEQAHVERANLSINWLFRPPAQVVRRLLLSSLELALMEEAQTRRQKGDNRRRCVLWPMKFGRRARLVRVFEEARELVLIIEARQQVVVDRSYHTVL